MNDRRIAVMREPGFRPERVNVPGGASAPGHPPGCKGTRIRATLLRSMRRTRARRDAAPRCVGVGQGIAVVENHIRT